MLKKLLDLILLTSVFTASCATGLCMATEQLVNHKTPYLFNHLHLLVFGCTLLVYNLHHAFKKSVAPQGLALLTNKPRMWYLAFSFSGLVMAVMGLLYLSW